jgi:hypothetical protein
MLKDWISNLESFSKRLGLARPPKLVVKQSRFLPLFPFKSWTPKPGAWAGMGRIIVSAALLDCSADRRQYLLAHELGHIAERHSRRGLRIGAAEFSRWPIIERSCGERRESSRLSLSIFSFPVRTASTANASRSRTIRTV